MKKLIVAIFVFAAAGTFAAYLMKPLNGSVITATTTPTSYTAPDGGEWDEVSISVPDGSRIYANINITTNDFVGTNSVPISSVPFTFGTMDNNQVGGITNIVVQAASGTVDFEISWQKR